MDFDGATLLGVPLVVGVAALAVAANETIRRRVRMGRRMLPLGIPDGEPSSEDVPDAKPSGAERPIVAFLDNRFPLSGGPRTAAVAAGCGVAGGTAVVPALVFVGLPGTLAAVGGMLLGAGIGWTIGAWREQRMRESFQDRFLLSIEDFERMARFGIGTGQAMASVASGAEDPVRPSLAKVAVDAELGVPLGVALGREARRVRISEMAMFAAIVSAQSRTGGGLTEAVANLAQMLRERIDNRARLKAATAEAKISLIILSAVPVAAVGILAATQPEIFETLLGSARHLLGIGVGLIAAGLTVAFFMVRSAAR